MRIALKHMMGGGQHLEQRNEKRPIFRSFEISNIKITKVELFDFLILELIFYFYVCSNYLNIQNTIIYQIGDFEIEKFQKFDCFTCLSVMEN